MTSPASREQDEGGSGGLLSQLPAIFIHRKWLWIIPLVLGVVGALAAWLLLPSTYRSSAVMLVQSSVLPEDVTGEGASDIIDRRIAQIRQQITSRPDLIALIQRNGLYQSDVRSEPMSKIIAKMRQNIVLTPTYADLPGGQQKDRTVAFELSFDYAEPNRAQAVTQQLMERVLELDSDTNNQQSQETVQFLTDQATGLETQISQIEGQIASINQRYGSVLSNSNVAMLGGSGGSYDVQIAQLQRDNAALLQQRDLARSSEQRDPVLVAAESQLTAARAVYSENHPDVIAAKQRVEQARLIAAQNTARIPTQTIDQQIAFNNSQISALRASKAREQGQVSATLSAQSQAPAVQQQIASLQQRLEQLNAQYQGVSQRLFAAKANVRAGDEQLGERLSVVDPPVVPDAAYWPNPWKLGAMGLAAGLGLGLLLVVGAEAILRPLRSPDAVSNLLGQSPLATIPIIKPKTVGRYGEGWKAKLFRWLPRRRQAQL